MNPCGDVATLRYGKQIMTLLKYNWAKVAIIYKHQRTSKFLIFLHQAENFDKCQARLYFFLLRQGKLCLDPLQFCTQLNYRDRRKLLYFSALTLCLGWLQMCL